MSKYLKYINEIIGVFIGIILLLLVSAIAYFIFYNPQQLGVWLGIVLEGITSVFELK